MTIHCINDSPNQAVCHRRMANQSPSRTWWRKGTRESCNHRTSRCQCHRIYLVTMILICAKSTTKYIVSFIPDSLGSCDPSVKLCWQGEGMLASLCLDLGGHSRLLGRGSPSSSRPSFVPSRSLQPSPPIVHQLLIANEAGARDIGYDLLASGRSQGRGQQMATQNRKPFGAEVFEMGSRRCFLPQVCKRISLTGPSGFLMFALVRV